VSEPSPKPRQSPRRPTGPPVARPVVPATSAHHAPTCELFGLKLSALTHDDVVRLVADHLQAPPGRGSLTLDATNTHGMAASCKSRKLHRSMSMYDHLLPDGMPLVWCMNAKGADLPTSVAGPHLIQNVLAGLPRRTKIAVIGGHGDMHRQVVEVSREHFPMAHFVLLYDVPYRPIDRAYVDDCLHRIEDSGADLVFVCLGVPRQCHWTALAKPILGDRVSISVGGAFAYISGEAVAPPAWMQRAGLWWLHRLYKEPRRLWKRYFVFNSLFLWYLLTKEILPGKFRRRRCL
jgi:N-acetylglucosaminyldiphosphoundecaprenol N-acetyl-beta-D-mannosaminyltransferase